MGNMRKIYNYHQSDIDGLNKLYQRILKNLRKDEIEFSDKETEIKLLMSKIAEYINSNNADFDYTITNDITSNTLTINVRLYSSKVNKIKFVSPLESKFYISFSYYIRDNSIVLTNLQKLSIDYYTL